MYQTTKKNPIRLVHRDDGVIHIWKGFDALVADWPIICRYDISDGPSHKKHWKTHDEWLREYIRNGSVVVDHHKYLIVDSFGDAIKPDDIRAAYRDLHPYIPKWGGYPNSRSPGRKRGSYRWFRHPRTTQERRWTHAWDDEEFAPKNGFARRARSARNLPEAWDDYVRQDGDNHNWKRHRRTQWK